MAEHASVHALCALGIVAGVSVVLEVLLEEDIKNIRTALAAVTSLQKHTAAVST